MARRRGCRDDDTADRSGTEKKNAPIAEEATAVELAQMAKEQGLSLTGPDGLLKLSTKSVLASALNEELTEHLVREKHQAPSDRDSGNLRNGIRPSPDGAASNEAARTPGRFTPLIPLFSAERLRDPCGSQARDGTAGQIGGGAAPDPHRATPADRLEYGPGPHVHPWSGSAPPRVAVVH